MAIAATAMVTATAALRGTVPGEAAVVGKSVAAIEVSAVSIPAVGEAAIGETMIDVPAIGKASVGVSATIVFALKTTSVKATAVEISGIPSFEKRPIVGIVGVVPIVAVPDRVVVVRIPGELSLKGYTVAIGIPIIGVGIGLLVRRTEMRVDIYLGIAAGGY